MAPNTSMDLLVSYPWGRFPQARHEAEQLLKRMGDAQATVEKSHVPGIAVAHTHLDNRYVIKQCKQLFASEDPFYYTFKWAPVDMWCETDLEKIKHVIDEQFRQGIGVHETWAMRLKKRTWQRYHTIEMIEFLAQHVDRRVNLRKPHKIIKIDILGHRTALALIKPDEIFSVGNAFG